MTAFYDPLDEETLADPYPVLARLRDEEPVFWHGQMDAWCLTRYDDCVTVLRDYRRFARDRRRTGKRHRRRCRYVNGSIRSPCSVLRTGPGARSWPVSGRCGRTERLPIEADHDLAVAVSH